MRESIRFQSTEFDCGKRPQIGHIEDDFLAFERQNEHRYKRQQQRWRLHDDFFGRPRKQQVKEQRDRKRQDRQDSLEYIFAHAGHDPKPRNVDAVAHFTRRKLVLVFREHFTLGIIRERTNDRN